MTNETMPLYQVQLETRTHIVSYEIATPGFDAVDLALEHLGACLPEGTAISQTGYSCIGTHPAGPPVVVDCRATSLFSTQEDGFVLVPSFGEWVAVPEGDILQRKFSLLKLE